MRKVMRRKSYRATTSLDRQIVYAVLMLEQPLLLGVSYPSLFALAALGAALHVRVFHLAVVHFGCDLTNPAKISTSYLYGSLVLGMLLQTWLWMVCMPASALAFAYDVCQRRRVTWVASGCW